MLICLYRTYQHQLKGMKLILVLGAGAKKDKRKYALLQ